MYNLLTFIYKAKKSANCLQSPFLVCEWLEVFGDMYSDNLICNMLKGLFTWFRVVITRFWILLHDFVLMTPKRDRIY